MRYRRNWTNDREENYEECFRKDFIIRKCNITVAAPKFTPTNISTKKPVKILKIISANSGSTNFTF
jgi:hypothetical protein